MLTVFLSCRGRDRTSTRQLAIAQSSVVDPGRINIAIETALCYVCPVILTPETRGHVCQKFHHPTIFKNFIEYKSKISSNYKEINQNKFKKNTFHSIIVYLIKYFQKLIY